MRMDLGLTQTIKQIQTLSPQMYMSMEILCLNSLDLEDRIDKEIEENIALEIADGVKAESAPAEADGGPEADAEPVAGPTTAAPEAEESEDAFDQKVEQWDRFAREEYDFQTGPRTGYDGDKDEKLEALNNTEGRPMSLQEYLEQQIHLLPREALGPDPEAVIELCVAIIYNIDDRGYLMYSLDEIHESLLREWLTPTTEEGERAQEKAAAGGNAPANGPKAPEAVSSSSAVASSPVSPSNGGPPEAGTPEAATLGRGAGPAVAAPAALRRAAGNGAHPEDGGPAAALYAPSRELLQKALEIVQSLDPPGVAGRDLKECLFLQLRRDGQSYPVETRIIEEHLDDLGNNRLPKIAKALAIPVDDVKAAAETIASLNPIPGKLFGGEPARFVKPDVVVEEVDGHYEVRVESEHLPRLQVSSYYRDLYRNAYKDPELKKFVKKKLESAEWLISAIRQRQSTLQRIAQEIVEIQKGFLDHGISHLKPLKMVEVGERVGVHVSTISRAISGKYVQTPRGIFDLKFFFTGGAVKSDGTMEARGSVIQRIKGLIEHEDKQNPLSDIDIVKKLEEFDIRISRRTVTKYREAENIPSSRQRRAY